jgi:hypothetical protein
VRDLLSRAVATALIKERKRFQRNEAAHALVREAVRSDSFMALMGDGIDNNISEADEL